MTNLEPGGRDLGGLEGWVNKSPTPDSIFSVPDNH